MPDGNGVRTTIAQAPRQQSLLWLAYVEGFQHAEIAQMLGMKEDSVKVVLLRARRELASTLTAQGLAPGGRR